MPSVTHRLRRGIGLGLPVFLGYVPIGAAFGMLARTAGFTLAQTVVCSMTVFAGAGQFVAVSLVTAGAGVATIVITTAVINLRHLLFGAALSPHLRGTPVATHAFLGFTMTDETFAVNITDIQETGTADELSMAAVGATAWSGWVGGTLLGALLGSLIGDPAAWGAGFAMTAMFTALLVGQATDRRHIVVGAVAGVLALAFSLALPGEWFVIAAAIAAATFGAVAFR